MNIDKSDKLESINTNIDESFVPYYTDIYSPGATKEKLLIGREVKGELGGNSKIGTFDIDSTGTIVVTGLGFTPKTLRIQACKSGGTGPIESDGTTDGTLQYVIYKYNTTGGMLIYFASDKLIRLEDGSSGTFVDTTATITSLDTDGFTIEITSYGLTGAISCIWTAIG